MAICGDVKPAPHMKRDELPLRFSMSNIVLVSQEGRVLTMDKPTTTTPMVEDHKEDHLHVIAAREAAKQSTKKHQ
jgi:hypothetical protein